MLVIDKRKVNDKGKNTPPSKNDDPMVTVEEVANRLPGAKSFTSLDAFSGYWQLLVDDESSKLF